MLLQACHQKQIHWMLPAAAGNAVPDIAAAAPAVAAAQAWHQKQIHWMSSAATAAAPVVEAAGNAAAVASAASQQKLCDQALQAAAC